MNEELPYLTPRAKKVLALARRIAKEFGNNWIGTEHIILGLIREQEGLGIRITRQHANLDTIRAELEAEISKSSQQNL